MSTASPCTVSASTTTITFTVDTDPARLEHFTDAYVAQLWHIAQANPAPFGDRAACEFAEAIGREIVRRWLTCTPPELWTHQGRHVEQAATMHAEVQP